jgi:hypothetical protein
MGLKVLFCHLPVVECVWLAKGILDRSGGMGAARDSLLQNGVRGIRIRCGEPSRRRGLMGCGGVILMATALTLGSQRQVRGCGIWKKGTIAHDTSHTSGTDCGTQGDWFARRTRTRTYPVAWCAFSVEDVRDIAIVEVADDIYMQWDLASCGQYICTTTRPTLAPGYSCGEG